MLNERNLVTSVNLRTGSASLDNSRQLPHGCNLAAMTLVTVTELLRVLLSMQ